VLAALGVRHAPAQRGWIQGNCPFHDDKNPSWRIRVTAERYGQHHCWACKAGGTLAGLVAHVRKVPLEEARGWVGEHAEPEEAPIPEVVGVDLVRRDLKPGKFRLPPEVVIGPLAGWVTPARAYAQWRGIEAWQVERWGLGYAVDGELAGRLVVPVWRSAGVAASYMARDFSEDRRARRYRYPRAEEGADPTVLFGQLNWPDEGARDVLVVTEGALNAMAVERAVGAGEAAQASLGGSGVHAICALKIASFPRVLVLTDNDPAGNVAAGELGAMLRALGRRPCRLRLLPGEDACDLARADLRAAVWRALGGDVRL
jgi:hypothetical protein